MEENFAYRLKYIIKLRGLSCYKLAKQSNVSKGTISNYINGKITTPDLMIISKICIILKVSPQWMLHGSGLPTICESDVEYMRYKTKVQITRQEIERARSIMNKIFNEMILIQEQNNALKEFIRKLSSDNNNL